MDIDRTRNIGILYIRGDANRSIARRIRFDRDTLWHFLEFFNSFL